MPAPAAAVLVLARAHSTSVGFSWRFGLELQPVLALIAGLLILLRPKLLNYIVASYLILAGIIGLLHLSF